MEVIELPRSTCQLFLLSAFDLSGGPETHGVLSAVNSLQQPFACIPSFILKIKLKITSLC